MINRNHLEVLFLLQEMFDTNFACFTRRNIYRYASSQEHSNFEIKPLLSLQERNAR